MITIEQPDPRISTCDCCGNRTTTLLRFVYKDEDAYAVYFASFTEDHPNKVVQSIVSIGGWGEDSSPEDRYAFALRFWDTEGQYNVEVIDAADSLWSNADTIGHKLSRAEALEHPLLPDVFHVTDHIFRDDEYLLSFFGHLRPDA
jgi:hypothetical protein